MLNINFVYVHNMLHLHVTKLHLHTTHVRTHPASTSSGQWLANMLEALSVLI